MRITFRRLPGHARAYSLIERDDGVVFQLRGSALAGPELPRDLRHFIVERELEIADGIWGGIAAGVDPELTQHQRLVHADLLASLVEAVAVLADPSEAEIARLTRQQLAAAVTTLPPPAALARAARALQVEAARWARLRPGEELVYEWHRDRPAAVRALPLVPRPRAADDRADPRHSGRRGPR
jgi:hypothetical protein